MKILKKYLHVFIICFTLIFTSEKSFSQGPSFSYNTSNTYVYGSAVTLSPSITSSSPPITWAINIALPAGLTIDSNSGTISGTPTAVSAATDYTVTATDATGSSTFTVNITVNPAVLTISGAAASNKVYDGGAAATITGTLNGVVGSDVVTLNGTGTFASSNVATGIGVTSTSTLGGADAGNYILTQPTGLTADIIAKNLTVTSTAGVNKTYDGTTAATITGTLSGIVGGDAVTFNGTGTFASANVGTSIAITSTSTLGGTDAGNYTLTQPTGLTANITAKALTVAGAAGVNKTYDGTTAANITGTLSGIVGGDAVTLNGTGTFASANVGTSIAITSTSTLGGTDAGNYTLTQPTGLTANITAKTLTVTSAAGVNKTYDGTTAATITGTLSGIVGGDAVTFNGTGTFASANFGTSIAITSTSTLGGADAGNYTLTQPTGLTANITAKALTVAGAAGVNKTYDGTAAATITGTLSGVIAGDVVSLNGTGTFASQNVANSIAITSTSTLGGAQAGNYTLTQPTGLTANITAKTLTVTSAAGVNKTYDQTTAATITGTLSGVIGGDVVTLNGTGTFASQNVANGIAITSTSTLGGAQAGNYTLTQPTGLTANITAKALTVSGAAGVNKIYDQTTAATITGTLSGVIAGDAVTLNGTGTFASPNVGTNIAVTSTSTLSGAQAGNYSLTQPTGLTANITAKTLTVAGAAGVNKVYDGTTAATITGTLSGVIAGDVVTLNGTGTFASPNVGTNIAVTSTSTLSGAQAGNYTLSQPTGLKANITSASLTITGMTANNKVYDGTTTATFTGGTLNSVQPGDVVSFSPSGTFATANVGTGIAVTSTTTLTGPQAGNYTLTQPTGLTANITAKTLTLTTVSANNKTYDTTPNATITATLNGVIAGDVVAFNGTGIFASANVGTNITVTSTSTLSGAQAGNYTFTQPTGLKANITPATLTVSLAKPNKTYDGTTVATLGSGTLAGVFPADAANVTLGGTPVGTFNSASVGNAKTVTVTGYTISGTAAGNYTLTQPTISGVKITAASLTITANDVNKVYGTALTTPVPSSTAFTSAGLVNGETIGSVAIAYGTAGTTKSTAVGTYSGQVTPSGATGGTFTASNYSITYKLGAIIVGSAPFDWTGASNSDWATPGNWTSAGIPQTANYPGLLGTTDIANIGVNNSFTNNPNIASNLPNSLAGINFGTGPGVINLTVNSGVTLAVSGNFMLTTGTETVNMTATNPTITIGGNFSSASGTTFNKGGSNPMTIAGTTTNAGTFNQSGTGLVTMTGAISNSGTINQTSTGNMVFTGDFTNSGSGSVLNQTGTGSLTFSGALTNAGTFTQGSGQVSIGGALTNTGTLNVGTSTFTVTGDFTNSGTYTQGTGTIVFSNPSNQFLRDASSNGTIFTNVEIHNGPNTKIQQGNFGIASTGVLTLSATTNNVTKVTVVSSLTIYSDANSTGTVAAICDKCTVNGNVTVQRYLSPHRGYRLIASPVNSATVGSNSVYSLNYVKNAAYITGSSGLAGGFDKTGNPTIYIYREDVPVSNSTFINGNYQGINNLNAGTSTPPTYTFDYTNTTGSYSIPISNGFLFFFRGNRSDGSVAQETVTTWPATTATLSTTGALNQNQVVFRDWYNAGSNLLGYSNPNVAAQGFNLAGNPYASSIDWETYNTTTTTSGIYTQNLSSYVYELNPLTQNYDVYQAGVGGTNFTNHGTRTIQSGQGFFVLALNSSAQLIFNESAKVNTQNTGLNLLMGKPADLTINDQHIRLQMAVDSINADDILIKFNDKARTAFDINEDAPYKVGTGKVSLSSLSADSVALAINQLPLTNGVKIPLKVGSNAYATYTLNLKDIKGVPQLFDIWLKDAFTGDSINMRTTPSYTFSIVTDPGSYGSHRFSIVLRENPALAYKLLDFTGEKINKRAVQLTWYTRNEQNYTNFTVERSNDHGKTYDIIGGMTGTGAGIYSLVDPEPVKGDNQYRLKSEDYNNTITYSDIIDEQFQDNGNNKSSRLSLYPNPTVSTIYLTIVPRSQGNTTYGIRISNSAGLVVKNATISDVNWQNNVSDLLTGTYLIEVVDNKDNSIVGQTKFIKL